MSVYQTHAVSLCRLVVILALSGWFIATATAHEINPSVVDWHIDADGSCQLDIAFNLEALLADIGPGHEDTDDSANATLYNELRRLSPDQLGDEFRQFAAEFIDALSLSVDGTPLVVEFAAVEVAPVGDITLARETRLRFRGQVPTGAQSLRWAWPARFGDNVLRVATPDAAEAYTAYLQNGDASDEIPLRGVIQQSAWQVLSNYLIVGFTHILPKGLDHILFVVGLFLLSARLSSLLWQVTSFTLAHSVTLALGVLGLVTVPAALVEPLIAASIVYVGIENVLTDRLSRWRPVLIFLFGLLHGLGFASVLNEFGLASGAELLVPSLLGFNLGVELGQLTVIALCFVSVGYWFRDRPWYRSRITTPASLLIALIGAYWFLERTLVN